jgi:hypothetical protein
MITPEGFRSELAGRLNEVLPEGFKAFPDNDWVCLDAPDGFGTSSWAGHMDDDPSDLNGYREAAWMVLSGLQDCVCETFREWWPMARTEPEHQMALPGASLDGTLLRLWYGDEHEPIVLLRPIDLRG